MRHSPFLPHLTDDPSSRGKPVSNGAINGIVKLMKDRVQIIAAAVPIFIAALALGAFMNGFCRFPFRPHPQLHAHPMIGMCVQGYFIKARSLPRFWYYSFHFMDYQVRVSVGALSIPDRI